MFAPCRAVRRAPSGYHWSQQTSTPTLPACMSKVAKAEIAGSEIKFFVVERVVGNMHLAIFAGERSIVLENCGGVVVDAGSTAFEQGSDDSDMLFFRDAAKFFRRGAGNGLGEIEERVIFPLTKILGAKQLGQADDIGAGAGSFANPVGGFVEVGVRVGGAGHLHQGDAEIRFRSCHSPAFSARYAWTQSIPMFRATRSIGLSLVINVSPSTRADATIMRSAGSLYIGSGNSTASIAMSMLSGSS